MKFSSIAFQATCLLLLASSCQSPNKETAAASVADDYDSEVAALIGQMTLEEKVGQMTQINIDAISTGEIYNLVEPNSIDTAKLRNVIGTHFVGSILNCGGHTYTLDEWHSIIAQIQAQAAKTRLKIPVLYGIDAIHGVNYTRGSTLIPQQLGQAATWDPSLVEQGAAITAYETRASGIPWNFSPVLGLARQPLWSRFFETYGEDTYLASEMGAACIRGYEGDDIANTDKVASCMKHFLGYSIPLTGKDRTPVYIHERQLREYLLPVFQSAIDAGTHTVMINSGEINGIPVHADKKILVDLLRDELGFKGLAVTDWEDIMKLNTFHRVASTQKEAVGIAINAGIDMSMVPNDLKFYEYLVELVNEGVVPMARINESVERILRVKYQLGLFDNPGPPAKDEHPKFGGQEYRDVAYNTAVNSLTLLKNNNDVLPLSADKKVLVVGAASNSLNILNGAWTHTWQGNDAKWHNDFAKTIQEAVLEVNPNASWSEGCSLDSLYSEEAVRKSSAVDHIVVCLGEAPSTEKPGDIADLNLSLPQKQLVRSLSKSGKPMTFVMVLNRPRIINDIEPLADAILMAYLPGDQGGKAIADVLFGKANPSGKLPFTYPRATGDFTLYNHKTTERLDKNFGMNAFNPQWEFGFGMSYADLTYGEIQMTDTVLNPSDTLEFSITIANGSDFDVREAVPVFIRDEYASITPEEKRLRAFDKVTVKSKSTQTVSFAIPMRELAFIGENLEYVLEAGQFSVIIGDNVKNFHLED